MNLVNPAASDTEPGSARSRNGAAALALARCGGRMARRMRGAYLVDFVLVMIAAMGLVTPLAEFLRLSMIDQALARATHRAALAVQRDPGNCQAAIQNAFQDDFLSSWLLDANDDGSVAIRVPNDRAAADGPLGAEEVLVAVDWDDPFNDGVCWQSAAGCSDTGCRAFTTAHEWLQLRARIGVRSWSGIDLWQGLEREHRSWASFESG